MKSLQTSGFLLTGCFLMGLAAVWDECPGIRPVKNELKRCQALLDIAYGRVYDEKECFAEGVNRCLCETELSHVFECYSNIYDACSEHEALSGLGWTFDQFMDYFFYKQLGGDCPRQLFEPAVNQ